MEGGQRGGWLSFIIHSVGGRRWWELLVLVDKRGKFCDDIIQNRFKDTKITSIDIDTHSQLGCEGLVPEVAEMRMQVLTSMILVSLNNSYLIFLDLKLR